MRFERVGRSRFVAVHRASNPTDEEWDAYVEAITSVHAAPVRAVFVVSDGGAPSAAQRRRLVEATAVRGAHPRVSVISPSPVVRLVVGAFNLVYPQPVRYFAAYRIDAAMDHLGATPAERSALLATAIRLARSLGVPTEALDRVA